MNSTRLPGAFTIAVGALFGIFAIISIMLGEGNTLANVFLYLIIGTCGLAVVAPRQAFFIFLVACGYVDLFKRLMVVSGRVSMDDLYYVLGLAPALFGCIIISAAVRGVIGGLPLAKQHVRLFLIGCAVVLANAVLSYLDVDHSLGKVMQGTANGGLYGMLIFVVPLMFRSEDDIIYILKFLLWTYAPVAIYGVAQQIWGFQDFEIAYLTTGLSIEIKQLFTDRVRAFSTLNSPTALSIVCATLFAIPTVLCRMRNAKGNRRIIGIPLATVFTLIFFGGLAASTGRSGFLMSAILLACVFAFRTRTGTIAFYAVAVCAFATLLISAKFLLSNIEMATMVLVDKLGGFLREDNININTFSDRLFGFTNVLMAPDAYTWFGYGSARGIDPRDPLYNHDLLSNTLVRYGAVVLLVMLVSVVFFLLWTHRQILSIQDKRRRNFAAAMLACAMSIFAISITCGNVLSIFPANTFFWLAVSGTIIAARPDPSRSRASSEAAKSHSSGAHAQPAFARPIAPVLPT